MGVDLNELSRIPGVEDSFVYSKWGELLVPQLPSPDSRLLQLGREIALWTFLLEKTRDGIDFFELIYEERHIIVRLSRDCFIMVVCDDTADTTLIKLTLNVVNEEVRGDKDIQKVLRKSSGKSDLVAEAKKESELQGLLKKMNIVEEG